MELTWNEYIREVLPEQKDRDVLRKFATAVLSGRRPDMVLFLFGSGRSGVTTIANTLRLALSDIERKDVIRVTQGYIANDFPGCMARIAGTPMVTILLEGDNQNSLCGAIKSLQGGDQIAARVPYGRNARYPVSFRGGVLLEGNYLPEWMNDPSIAKRITIITPVRIDRFRNLPLMEYLEDFAEQLQWWV